MKPFEQQNYYELLEVPVSAPADDVRAAYSRLMELYAPDSIAVYALVAPEQVDSLRTRMTEAMETLTNAELRAEYDKGLGLPTQRMVEAVASGRTPSNEARTGASTVARAAEPLVSSVTPAVSAAPPPEEPAVGPGDFRATFFRGFSFAYVSSSLQDTQSLGNSVYVPSSRPATSSAEPRSVPANDAVTASAPPSESPRAENVSLAPASSFARASAEPQAPASAVPVPASVSTSSNAGQGSPVPASVSTSNAPVASVSTEAGPPAPLSVAASVSTEAGPPAPLSAAASVSTEARSPAPTSAAASVFSATRAPAPVSAAASVSIEAGSPTALPAARVAVEAAPPAAPVPVSAESAPSAPPVAPKTSAAVATAREPALASTALITAPSRQEGATAHARPQPGGRTASSRGTPDTQPPPLPSSSERARHARQGAGPTRGNAQVLSQDATIATAEAALAVAARVREPQARPRTPEIPPDAEFNGELLRRVREARGQSLQQVADRTRITRSHLENVEADRYAALPPPVYLRGILMNLARELGLDPLRVSRSYLTLASEKSGKK